jgi:hypothetical protein
LRFILPDLSFSLFLSDLIAHLPFDIQQIYLYKLVDVFVNSREHARAKKKANRAVENTAFILFL